MTMLRDGLVWVLHSPTRLLVTAAVLFGALIVSVVFVTTSTDNHDESLITQHGHFQTTGDGTPTKSETETPTGPEPSSMKSAAVVDRFLDLYLQDSSDPADRIPKALQPFSTEALWRGLRVADVADLPTRPVVDVEVEQAGQFVEQYSVTLHGGAILLVEAVLDGQGWRVADVQLESEP